MPDAQMCGDSVTCDFSRHLRIVYRTRKRAVKLLFPSAEIVHAGRTNVR